MAISPTPGSRGVVTETAEGLELAVPARRNWMVAVFLAGWLVAWFFGEMAALEQLRESFETTGEPEPFLIVWLIGWTIGGAFAAFTLLRNFIGTERLSINGGEITIRNEVFGIGNNRRYAVHEVSNLRIVNRTGATTAPDSPVDMTNVGGLSQASIAFDHGDATVMFGSGLSTTEAELFVDKALRRYSTLGRTDT